MIKVTAAIILNKDKILITKRRTTMKLPNLWEFPGGKLEENEAPEDCVIREIDEELGITIKVHSHFLTNTHHYEFGDVELMSYLAVLIGGQIELREHAEYKWVDIEDLSAYEFAPADVPIINKIREEGISI
ncbi:(deoxy)nucleoside triphosphate pyrophosphohydrolase [Aquibacillus salsiterrae]|uniref:8-oxo-dGTP diphosphatase n=1 Tax=Aquibacillus salsiterrae TaxID=2950439 RepID=A0A9X4AG66_9BACI|nr:(deoxy)nucleoside triphosphate pyrophosphohydrolase [Aquibacillus salsiterrae]MDC3418359.1 (deoxy)nucleoside triphosphate pyrophosphohydrolase [Aquibacillus salsiterrae]